MLSEKMFAKLNDQINKEIYSAYLYVGMQGYAFAQGLEGAANWFNHQAREELGHAQKIYAYVMARGPVAVLEEIAKPPQEYGSLREVFEKTLEHEKKVTGLIAECVETAQRENDEQTKDFLRWFVDEQIEEEESVAAVIREFQSAGGDKEVLRAVNEKLSLRKR